MDRYFIFNLQSTTEVISMWFREIPNGAVTCKKKKKKSSQFRLLHFDSIRSSTSGKFLLPKTNSTRYKSSFLTSAMTVFNENFGRVWLCVWWAWVCMCVGGWWVDKDLICCKWFVCVSYIFLDSSKHTRGWKWTLFKQNSVNFQHMLTLTKRQMDKQK